MDPPEQVLVSDLDSVVAGDVVVVCDLGDIDWVCVGGLFVGVGGDVGEEVCCSEGVGTRVAVGKIVGEFVTTCVSDAT